MALEIARRLINNVWQTVEVDESAGGGGSLPAQWTVDPVTGGLTIDMPAGSDVGYTPAITIKVAGEVVAELRASGSLDLFTTADIGGGYSLTDRVSSGFFWNAYPSDFSMGAQADPANSADDLIHMYGDTRQLAFFSSAVASQQTMARPAGDAGALWDVLAAYGLVKAP